MEIIQGKKTFFINQAAFQQRIAGFEQVMLDLGTGDGYFVRRVAAACCNQFHIGLDACRENLRQNSRNSTPNTLYIIANIEALPSELVGLPSWITINFPWGSLLEGLCGVNAFTDDLANISRPGTILELRLNSGAITKTGWPFEAMAECIRQRLQESGFAMNHSVKLKARDLRKFPSTWAKRLAFGREPFAYYLYGIRI